MLGRLIFVYTTLLSDPTKRKESGVIKNRNKNWDQQ